MKKLLVLLLAALTLAAGCLDDSSDDGDGMDEDDNDDQMDDNRTVPETLEFSFGPSLGCEGSSAGPESCASFNAGPDAPAVDGFWLPLTEDYWGLSFTSTVENAVGDSDCYFLDANAGVLGDGHQGQAACSGTIPKDTAHMFIYSFLEPHTGITVTFQAPMPEPENGTAPPPPF